MSPPPPPGQETSAVPSGSPARQFSARQLEGTHASRLKTRFLCNTELEAEKAPVLQRGAKPSL